MLSVFCILLVVHFNLNSLSLFQHFLHLLVPSKSWVINSFLFYYFELI